jgi:beta-N-acetylhexosaminidase
MADWKQLTLRQKIGQTMVMLPDQKRELELGGGSYAGFFERYPVGGFYMGWRLFDGIEEQDRVDHLLTSAKEYQAASALPLLYQEDYEAGVHLPGMTPMPVLMSLGATDSEDLAYTYGKHVAKEARSVGVRWVLHPCVDLSLNPHNPITNTRTMSDDPERAVRLLCKQIAGLQDHGMAATAKHFPGDGTDTRDQHLCTVTNVFSMSDWWTTYGKVYQAVIDAGIMAIMPAHITLPAYQKAKGEIIDGCYPPATISKAILGDLLKGELGFQGVLVSDAMVMAGIRSWYPKPREAEIQSFMAGIDIVLWPDYPYMDEVETRIQRGEIPMERLDEAVERVWDMKRKLGLLDSDRALFQDITPEEKEEAARDSLRITESAITLVRDRKNSLPLDPAVHQKILVVGVVPKSRKGGDGGFSRLTHFKKELEERGFTVDLQHNILYETDEWHTDLHEHYDRILVLALRGHHAPFGPLLYWDDEAQSVWGVNAMPRDQIIVIGMGSPYLVDEYFERVETCVNAYSYDEATQSAVVRALMGEIPFVGSSPVSLNRPEFSLPGNN